MYPKRHEDLTIREVEGEVIILNHRLGQIHQLNATASYIWNLCDGQTSLEKIILLVSGGYGVSVSEIDKDVANIIAQFVEKGLVEGLELNAEVARQHTSITK